MFQFIKIFTSKKDNHSNNYMNKYKEIKDYTREYDPLNVDSIAEDDYLGLAASAKHRAKIATKEKDYDLAWNLYIEQLLHLSRHIEKYNLSSDNLQALQGGINHDMANILRLEKRHTLALVHLIYAISTNPNVAYMMKKLPAYYKRSKINVDFDEVMYFIYEQEKDPNFRTIKNKIYE